MRRDPRKSRILEGTWGTRVQSTIALITGFSILVASAATAEAPDVEAHLEEAAAAAVALQRVLAQRQPSAQTPCRAGDCGSGGMGRRQAIPNRAASPTNEMGVGAGRGADGMQAGGMGKMMEKMGGMNGMPSGLVSEAEVPTPGPATANHGPAESEPSPRSEDSDGLASDHEAHTP